MQRKRQPSGKNILINPYHGRTQQRAKLVHEAREVACAMQLLAQPRLLHARRKIWEHRIRALGLQRRHDALRRQHAALHRRMIAFYFYAIQRTRITADQNAPWKCHFGQ